MVRRVAETLEGEKVFWRARKGNGVRALGALLYPLGLSTRRPSRALRGLSNKSVRRRSRRRKGLFAPPARPRRAVAPDETHGEVQGRRWYLWIAVDVDARRSWRPG
jgi:transposase-like protein